MLIEDLYNTLELIHSRAERLRSKAYRDPNKKAKSARLIDIFEFKFDMIEERLMDAINELNAMGINVCTPIFGAIDIPVVIKGKKIAYICYDHTIEDEEDFLCHMFTSKGKKLNKLERYNDL